MIDRDSGQFDSERRARLHASSVCPNPSWPFGARTEECDLFDAMPLREKTRAGLPLVTGFFDYIGKALWVSFAIVVLTGIALLAGYRPTVDASFRSVEHIQTAMSGGWWLRGLHKYATDLFVIVALLRLVRIAYRRAYKYPGEFNWIAAVGVLLFGIASAFTGYMLVWNQNASVSGIMESTSTGFADNRIPPIITWDWIVDQGTLSLAFMIHIALSVLFLLFILKWRLNARWQAPRYKSFQPKISAKLAWTILGVLTLLAMSAPPPLGSPSDRALSPSPVLSDWFLLGWHRLFDSVPYPVAIILLAMSLGLILLLPWLDRIRVRGPRPIITAILTSTIVTWLIFTIAEFIPAWRISRIFALVAFVWTFSILIGAFSGAVKSDAPSIKKSGGGAGK